MATNATVKFYSMSAEKYASKTKDSNSLYFVDGGELYKGTQRFGLAKVFTYAEQSDYVGEGDAPFIWDGKSEWVDLSSVTGMARGDIAVGYGAAKVFDGNSWVDLTGDVNLSESAVMGGSNGVFVSVTTENGQVTDVQVAVDDLEITRISATHGNFDYLYASAAMFSATMIEANTLLINGDTFEDAVDARIAAVTTNTITSTGTSLPTESAIYNLIASQITNLGNVMHFAGVVDGQTGEGHQQYLPTSGTTGDIWVITGANTISAPETGYATSPSTVEPGQEYVWTGTAWEVIGDQSTYATNARVQAIETQLSGLGEAAYADILGSNASAADWASSADLVTASLVYSYVSTKLTASTVTFDDTNCEIINNAQTVQAAVEALDSAIVAANNAISGLGDAAQYSVKESGALLSNGNRLPTEAAVYEAITSAIAAIPVIVDGSSTSTDKGITVTAETVAGQLTTVSVSATLVAITSSATVDEIPNAKAVYDAIQDIQLLWYDDDDEPIQQGE